MVGGGIFALRRPRPYRRRIRTHCEEDLIVVRYFENAPPAPPKNPDSPKMPTFAAKPNPTHPCALRNPTDLKGRKPPPS